MDVISLRAWCMLLGCIECMRCRLLLPMCAVSVRLSVTRLNFAARAFCAGSFDAAFAKLLWPLVGIAIVQGNSTLLQKVQ